MTGVIDRRETLGAAAGFARGRGAQRSTGCRAYDS